VTKIKKNKKGFTSMLETTPGYKRNTCRNYA